jgi:hydroxypyruvate isomerase
VKTQASVRYAANCSLLFTEFPPLERAAAAKAAGFDAVEFWWPFADPVPDAADVEAFVTSVEKAGVALVGLNFYAGDLAGPDCGVLSDPSRSAEFRGSVPIAVEIGLRLGTRAFNALYGNRVPGVPPDVQDELATENLLFAAGKAAAIGSDVLIEPISGPKPYPLRRVTDVIAVLSRLHAAGAHNTTMLFDIYHLATNGEDISAAIAAYADQIGHVQIADSPGRGEPGSGALHISRYLRELRGASYSGWFAMEYKPSGGDTAASLQWKGKLQ